MDSKKKSRKMRALWAGLIGCTLAISFLPRSCDFDWGWGDAGRVPLIERTLV
jgi:hypothetical protein